MLKIAVKDISAAGVELSGALAKEEFDVRPQEIKSLAPVMIEGKIERTAAEFYATVKAQGKFQYVCGRCLEVGEEEFSEDFEFHYPIDSQVSHIDVGVDVREEIILGFADKVLCDPDCRGLCLKCGANLNNEKCKCKK